MFPAVGEGGCVSAVSELLKAAVLEPTALGVNLQWENWSLPASFGLYPCLHVLFLLKWKDGKSGLDFRVLIFMRLNIDLHENNKNQHVGIRSRLLWLGSQKIQNSYN